MRKYLKLFYVVFSAILISVCRGIKEGMVMEKNGVRKHRWYSLYHRISILVPLAAGLFFIALSQYWRLLNIWIVIGLFLLSWQMFEFLYTTTRFRKLVPDTENVFGLGFYIKGKYVLILHTARITAGLIFLIMGLNA